MYYAYYVYCVCDTHCPHSTTVALRDTVLLKGKKRKNTVAVVNTIVGVSDNRARMTKVVRSNLR